MPKFRVKFEYSVNVEVPNAKNVEDAVNIAFLNIDPHSVVMEREAIVFKEGEERPVMVQLTK